MKYAGKYANINGRKLRIVDALSGGPDCPPREFLLEGGRTVFWSAGEGWILQDHGNGRWIPSLSIFGVHVKTPCRPCTDDPSKILECLQITTLP
jgi:hypothetical protein